MRERLRHSLRFAIPTLLAVYLAGMVWEAIDVFLIGDVDLALGATRTLLFNERQWRIVSLGVAGAVFLLKLGDIRPGRPSRRYAAAWALWVGLTAVAVGVALEEGRWQFAVMAVVLSATLWYLTRRRIPGRPAAAILRAPAPLPGTAGRGAEAGEAASGGGGREDQELR